MWHGESRKFSRGFRQSGERVYKEDMAETLLPPWTNPKRVERWVIGVQIAVATLILAPALVHPGSALPGKAGLADLPGTINFHWLVHTQSFAELRQSNMLMYPSQMDRLLLDGMPLDALASWPFVAALGWPAGFTIFQWLCFIGLGVASAWMARGWWGHAGAAAIAGVVAQTQPFLIRELINGRPTQVFGAIFLPLCLGFVVRALAQPTNRNAILAGVCWGLGTLSYWYYGAFFGLCIAFLLGAAMFEHRLRKETVLGLSIGLMAVVAVPLSYVLRASSKIPGQGAGWDTPVTHGGHTLTLETIIEHRDLGANIITDRVMALQLLVVLLMAMALKSAHRRRWSIPLIWLGSAVLFAMGPTLGTLGIPGPFALFEWTELTARMWWPDRSLVMAGPAIALLAAGGAKYALDRWAPDSRHRWSLVIVTAILIEAFVVIPGLPIPVTWGTSSPQSEILAEGSGPVLILPIGTGKIQPDAQMLIDQVHHGRPLINGPMPYSSSTAPADYRRRVQSIALAPFLGCELTSKTTKRPSTEDIIAALHRLDLTGLYLDLSRAKRFMKNGDVYQQCVEQILGIQGESIGPFVFFPLPSATTEPPT
jgi:hypothetical protein